MAARVWEPTAEYTSLSCKQVTILSEKQKLTKSPNNNRH